MGNLRAVELVMPLDAGERLHIIAGPVGCWLGIDGEGAIPADNQTEITWAEWDVIVQWVAQMRERSNDDGTDDE